MRTIYYYQKDVGLDQVINNPEHVDEIIISSIHFKNKRMILNDDVVESKVHYQLLEQAEELFNSGVHISLMIGGAGKAFKELFNNVNHYYTLLNNFLKTHPFITGVNLDVEETVNIEDLVHLIAALRVDMGDNFKITLAPMASVMSEDVVGLGGFLYKELYNRIGDCIDSFNVQSYGELSFNSLSADTYQNILDNGYPMEKINLGMLYSDYNRATFDNALISIKQIQDINPDAGIFVWEYALAPPDNIYHTMWANAIKNINNESSCAIS